MNERPGAKADPGRRGRGRRAAADPDLAIEGLWLDRARREPLAQQLARGLREAVESGRLAPGARLPSSRRLAAGLGVSRGVASDAVELLVAEGFAEARAGAGTFVAHRWPRPGPGRLEDAAPVWLRGVEPPALVDVADPSVAFDLTANRPATDGFPIDAWRAAWRRALRRPPADDYAAPEGDRELRVQIARHVGIARGLACTADHVLVTSGALQAFEIVARASLAPGAAVAFEEPGFRQARRAIERGGGRIVPVPVDADGLDVGRLRALEPAPAAVYVTPSHQFPLGSRLSLARRRELLGWARSAGAFVIEDDYDSEFRFDAAPLPALASLDRHGDVVYVGTFSKALSPVVRVGYLIGVPALIERARSVKTQLDYHTSLPMQQALAWFMASGAFARHVAQVRDVYAERRAALVDGLGPLPNGVRLAGLAAGLHALLELPSPEATAAVVAAARADGVAVHDVAKYFVGKPTVAGVLLGFGHLAPAPLREAAGILGRHVRALAAP